MNKKIQSAIAESTALARPPSKTQLPWPYITAGCLALVVLLWSAYIASSRTMPAWEISLFTSINGASFPDWVTTYIASPLSDAVWGLVGLTIFALAVPRWRMKAWQYAVPGGAAYCFIALIEHAINRMRPESLLTDSAVIRASQDGPGFPSGHVGTLTALLITLFPFVSWPWRVIIMLMIAGEAWSRIYLGVHAPLDVVGGVAAGVLVVVAIRLVPARIKRPFRVQ